MRRLVVESEATTLLAAAFPRVCELLSDLPRAMRLVSAVSLVAPLTPSERSYDAARERYHVHLGPFGAGGFSGTLRLVLDVRRIVEDDRYALELNTLSDRGNADVSIHVEAQRKEAGTPLRCSVRVAPRKEVPALLPIGVVRLAAAHILKGAIAAGLAAGARSLGDG